MSSTVSGAQVRETLKAVIATTQNRTAKQILTRALNMLDVEGYGTAAAYLTRSTSRSANLWHRIFIPGLIALCTVLWGAVILIMFKAQLS